MEKAFNKKIFFLFLVGLLYVISCGSSGKLKEADNLVEPYRAIAQSFEPPIKVLALDGGGVRSLITVSLLQAMEEDAQKPAHQLFDLIAGTSTGGLIAAAVTRPTKRGGATAMSAQELKEFIKTNAANFFSASVNVTSFFGFVGSADPEKNKTKMLDILFGNSLFKDSLKPTLLTTTDIERGRGYSLESDLKQYDNLKTADAVHATFTIPLTHKPKKIHLKDSKGGSEEHYLIGGELYKNNAALLAYEKARIMFGDETVKQRGIIMVSLGAGVRKTRDSIGQTLVQAGALTWKDYIIGAIIDGSASEDEEIISLIFEDQPKSKLFRIQPKLDSARYSGIMKIDNVENDNIANLLGVANEAKNSDQFKAMLESLRADDRD